MAVYIAAQSSNRKTKFIRFQIIYRQTVYTLNAIFIQTLIVLYIDTNKHELINSSVAIWKAPASIFSYFEIPFDEYLNITRTFVQHTKP